VKSIYTPKSHPKLQLRQFPELYQPKLSYIPKNSHETLYLSIPENFSFSVLRIKLSQ
jgi:hypothetical protein